MCERILETLVRSTRNGIGHWYLIVFLSKMLLSLRLNRIGHTLSGSDLSEVLYQLGLLIRATDGFTGFQFKVCFM